MDESKVNLRKIEKKLKKYLDEERMWHTIGVMHTAAAMAMAYGADLEKAQLAGLLHDCAKCVSSKDKFKICKENHIPVTDFEKKHPFLLHAKVGAWIAREKYGVKDQEILDSIIWHTTGKEQMSVLEKIIYIADYIEPARDKAPRLPEIRRLAFLDLDRCMYEILKDTLEYLDEHPEDIDQTTKRAYDYYKETVLK
ncbi:MAG: bis(5'-nucleosyl)-tetraphosphatase (symmetrical) YqeK [Clostridiales bacterium]|nr:bis(5'-nucleosyl)-tetraphosphatase (symmetrical) YqeK [Clostridiales bacterium]